MSVAPLPTNDRVLADGCSKHCVQRTYSKSSKLIVLCKLVVACLSCDASLWHTRPSMKDLCRYPETLALSLCTFLLFLHLDPHKCACHIQEFSVSPTSGLSRR